LREITILEKIYRNRRDAKKGLAKILDESLEIDAKVVSVSRAARDWATVSIEGPDEEIAEKYLETQYGRVSGMGDLEEGEIRRGKIVDLVKIGYGIYVDIGVVDSGDRPVDALVPSFSLKKHLGVKGIMSVKQIAHLLGLMDYFPLDIRIFQVDKEKGEIEARLTNSQARRLRRGRNRFHVCGETRRKIKNAIQKTGNSEKVVRIRRLGLLECEVQCSKDVNPHDILREIGPMLNAQMAVPRGL
jgi:hypothetical protein